MSEPRTRRSFRELENEHYQKVKDHQGSKGRSFPFELETLVLAFSKIQDPNYEDFNSFFTIAGYHGEPFRGAVSLLLLVASLLQLPQMVLACFIDPNTVCCTCLIL